MNLTPSKLESAQSAEQNAAAQALQEFRCNCGKLLFKGLGIAGVVELKCKRCNCLKRFDLSPTI
jgi:hypothetical protein